jgi:hypothetical protein
MTHVPTVQIAPVSPEQLEAIWRRDVAASDEFAPPGSSTSDATTPDDSDSDIVWDLTEAQRILNKACRVSLSINKQQVGSWSRDAHDPRNCFNGFKCTPSRPYRRTTFAV